MLDINWMKNLQAHHLDSLLQRSKSLAVCKLLSGVSNNIEEEAYYCAMEGKLRELAALLIVARENVLLPITFHGTNGSGLSGMTIPQCVRNQVFSLIDEEAELKRNCKLGKLTHIQEKMEVMRSMALLLEIFEKVGHTIEEYLSRNSLMYVFASLLHRINKILYYLHMNVC